jgi:predicted Zn-dependent protease
MTIRACRLLITAVVLLVGGVGAGCSKNVATGRYQYIVLSPEDTRAMGEQAAPQMLSEMGGEVASPALRAYVRGVGERLLANVEEPYRELDWEFFCLDSDVINAFALPGGKVFITRGLMSHFRNEAQVAGVLGHEIGHVTARHVDERLSQTMTAQLGLAVLGQYSKYELVTAGADTLAQFTLLKFNRDQESESDRLGVRYMTQAGYDPHGMVEVLEVLSREAAEGSPPEILSTHPHPESRLEDVRELLSGSYAFTQGNAEYDKGAERFEREAQPLLR